MQRSESQEIGSRLERVRRMEGLSQGKFCDALEISRTSLQNYVRGDRELPLSVLARLLEQFAIDPVWIMYGDDSAVGMQHKSKILTEIRSIGIAVEKRAVARNMVLTTEERWRLVTQIYTALMLVETADKQIPPNDFILDQMFESNGYS